MMEFINIDDDDGDDENGQQLQKHDQADVVDEEKEEEAGNPLAIKITLVVQNFLSTSSDSQQLLALKILQNTLHALTDTRDVLPLINEVWPALSHRLNKGRDSFYVTLAACDVVSTACRIGEGWMRQRVRDDLWLHFRRILHDTEPQSVVQRSSDCELVRRVLATMQTVVECVPVDEAIAWDLAWLSLRFVSQKPVEDHAVGLLKAMVPMHGDKIWLILAKLGRTSISPDSIPHLGIPETIRTPEDICRKLDLQI
ncbi:hypothetical protein GGI12_005212 [Dipsacomyces acuminosporus]|nr:hypothetical protein GGI12_005212 [Dipsacomyces acuminosporus]